MMKKTNKREFDHILRHSTAIIYSSFVSVITQRLAGPVGSKCSFCMLQYGFD